MLILQLGSRVNEDLSDHGNNVTCFIRPDIDVINVTFIVRFHCWFIMRNYVTFLSELLG